MFKRMLVYGSLGLGISLAAQVAYVLCLFNEALAKLLLVPLLYVAFWPAFLLDLVGRGGPAGPEGRPLGANCLLSLAGWLAAGILAALVRSLLQRVLKR